MEMMMRTVYLMTALLVSMGASTHSSYAQTTPPTAKPKMVLFTTAFADGGVVPIKYSQAAEGGAVSPKLTWANAPDGTVSFAVIATDPDGAPAKSAHAVLHWMIFNIPGTATELPEGVANQSKLTDGSEQGINTGKKVGYMGMGAPAPGPYHHYTFVLYALDTKLSLEPEADQAEVEKAMDGHVLMKAAIVGLFHRP
jgi:Raf kinase inhibitor-like YbhB/YbcL family protein